MNMPLIVGQDVIPEAQCVIDVAHALEGHGGVVLLSHVAGVLGQEIPEGSTIYNLEPLFSGCRSLQLGYLDVLRKFPVWDYQARNVEFLASHGIEATHVPYGYSKRLEREPSGSTKDIEILFVGSSSPRREKILNRVSDVAPVTWVRTCYGEDLDRVIQRAKVVLNVHYTDRPHPLEVVRLQYLMANQCFVISERGWDDEENEKYEPGLVFSDDLAASCSHWLASDRFATEQNARRVARAMPLRPPTIH